MNAQQFLQTIAEYNAAVRTDVPFNPNVKDGRCTEGLARQQEQLGKHHRSAAVRRLCGDLRASPSPSAGLRITNDAEVLNTDYQPIRGLYAAGELVGGMFYFNYPGGSGLTSGAVFGRIAGSSAARAGKN